MKRFTSKRNWNADLPNDLQALLFQTTGQCDLIHNLKQSGSQRSMEVDAFINNKLSDLLPPSPLRSVVFSHPLCLVMDHSIFHF